MQELLDDKDITEIMVNGRKDIFIEKRGRTVKWDKSFKSDEQLEDMIQQIVSEVNRVVNVSSPIADARLKDGSRVHIVLPPVSLSGPIITIRKFPEVISMDRLIALGAISSEVVYVLKKLVKSGYNIFISGGTNSGKTTFLNALSGYIPFPSPSRLILSSSVLKSNAFLSRFAHNLDVNLKRGFIQPISLSLFSSKISSISS